jgi:hypothetical protein
MSGIRVLGKIFRPKKEEVREGWKKLQNEKFYNVTHMTTTRQRLGKHDLEATLRTTELTSVARQLLADTRFARQRIATELTHVYTATGGRGITCTC